MLTAVVVNTEPPQRDWTLQGHIPALWGHIFTQCHVNTLPNTLFKAFEILRKCVLNNHLTNLV